VQPQGTTPGESRSGRHILLHWGTRGGRDLDSTASPGGRITDQRRSPLHGGRHCCTLAVPQGYQAMTRSSVGGISTGGESRWCCRYEPGQRRVAHYKRNRVRDIGTSRDSSCPSKECVESQLATCCQPIHLTVDNTSQRNHPLWNRVPQLRGANPRKEFSRRGICVP